MIRWKERDLDAPVLRRQSWLFFTHTFSALPAGQTVRLRITSTNNQTLVTNFFFDTLSLKATHCP